MANRYQYSTPYQDIRVAPLPPDYMEAATAPGRNLAAGITSFGEDVGDAIKQHKDDAKATKSMRSLIGIYKPELKDEAETWSKSELEGKIKGFIMQQDEAERASIQSLRGAQTDQMQAAQSEIERQAKAAAMFNQSVANQQPNRVASVAGAMADPRSGVTLSSLSQFAGQNPVMPKLTPETVMRLAAMSGALTPELAADLSQFAVKADGRHQFTADQMGRPTEVPGIPGKFFVPTSTGGGQLVDTGAPATGAWQEQFLPDGRPTGWAIASDGNMRRLRDKRDDVGAEQYDVDGDGIISQEEFQAAVVAEKFGGVWPGQRVGGTKPSATAPPANPSDAYRAWKNRP